MRFNKIKFTITIKNKIFYLKIKIKKKKRTLINFLKFF